MSQGVLFAGDTGTPTGDEKSLRRWLSFCPSQGAKQSFRGLIRTAFDRQIGVRQSGCLQPLQLPGEVNDNACPSRIASTEGEREK